MQAIQHVVNDVATVGDVPDYVLLPLAAHIRGSTTLVPSPGYTQEDLAASLYVTTFAHMQKLTQQIFVGTDPPPPPTVGGGKDSPRLSASMTPLALLADKLRTLGRIHEVWSSSMHGSRKACRFLHFTGRPGIQRPMISLHA